MISFTQRAVCSPVRGILPISHLNGSAIGAAVTTGEFAPIVRESQWPIATCLQRRSPLIGVFTLHSRQKPSKDV